MITIFNALKRAWKSTTVSREQIVRLKEAQAKEKTSNINNSKIVINGQVIVDTKNKKTLVPKGWFVSEAGQNPLHMLWFVVLVSFDDIADNIKQPRYFISEEKNSFEEALQDCVKQINE